MIREELIRYLDGYLQAFKFKDYAPNGLQVEGKEHISTIITGVTASQALIDAAIEKQADAILVHHGYFWKGEPQVITGMKQKRIKALLEHEINLIGYHLPLDAHPEVGNNVQLGQKLGIEDIKVVDSVSQDLLWSGKLKTPVPADEFQKILVNALGRESLHIGDEKQSIQSIAWCTGGAQDYIDIAAQLGVDAYISGEVSERTFHSAIEQGIHYFSAGHHATERYGIQALGEHLGKQFGLSHQFIDIPNPV
ncbi:Nif3-like dinuclear metal center hexameric protein [Parashewanella curva]|uniref:GTP cyclohydrolase 1 type 2 homolog n=1 Tax=Parashewanella curva TaxID=2338552 RepID=A0A3L8PXX7_9GAMM|nr:Nif3-like dinuclear metal center hexameric protein [Parashewanella curva]RLV60115.1 Nif3-like dinuclear metal center hexameric protein [Parashewanella curva]